jgi:hypothetical protein
MKFVYSHTIFYSHHAVTNTHHANLFHTIVMRLFSKPSFGDLRCKTSLHGSRCKLAWACPRPAFAHTRRRLVAEALNHGQVGIKRALKHV